MCSRKTKIKVEKLYKIFGKNPEKAFELIDEGLSKKEIMKKTRQVVALRDISFEVKEGEIFVLMGLSGSGKSTLLRCINRLKDITEGCVYVDGQDISSLSAKELRLLRRGVFGMVFQRFALLPHRTVIENVTFGLEIQGVPKKSRQNKGGEALELVGLTGWENTHLKNLSGGMRQRVGLARALAIDPEILLMDEPFSALDPLVRTKMQDELIRLQKKMKKTIVFVTHDLNEAIKLGDRIGIINSDGELVQVGGPEEILLDPANSYIESFLSDVDRPSVIRAESVMEEPDVFPINSSTGEILSEMEEKDLYYAFLEEEGRFRGVVARSDLEKAGDKKEDAANFLWEIKPADPIDTIADILPRILDSFCPVPITGDDGSLIGEVTRAHVSKILRENQDGL